MATATATLTSTLTSTEREALAQKVASAFAKLAQHKEDIEQLWREFAALKDGEAIMGCTTKTEFCERVLGRSIRAIQYLINGGNHNRGNRRETVSPEPAVEPVKPVQPLKPWTPADEKRKNRSEPLESEKALLILGHKAIDLGCKRLLDEGYDPSHVFALKTALKTKWELEI